MTDRIAYAFVKYIRHLKGESKYIFIEGISEDLAEAISLQWTSITARERKATLPPLMIGSQNGSRFGEYSLGDRSGTQLRNLSGSGVCFIACEGFQVVDWQSISRFVSISPTELLGLPDSLSDLMAGRDDATIEGPLAHVRQALLNISPAFRPTIYKAADYLDSVAAGEDPLESLPKLGAFTDKAAQTLFNSARLIENLKLAATIRALSARETQFLRKRATRAFLRDGSGRSAEQLVALIDRQGTEIFDYLSFDEARTLVEEQSVGLVALVLEDLEDFRHRITASNPAVAATHLWHEYEHAARGLDIADDRIASARSLLEVDLNAGAVFEPGARRKLEAILRNKAIVCGGRSLNAAFIEGITLLSTDLVAVELHQANVSDELKRANCKKAISVAVCRLLISDLLKRIKVNHGILIDGALTSSPLSALKFNPKATPSDVFSTAKPLAEEDAHLLIRLKGSGEQDTVDIKWAPGLDDLAFLKAIIVFSESPSLTLNSNSTDVRQFLNQSLYVHAVNDFELQELASHLRLKCKDLLTQGASPELLSSFPSKYLEFIELVDGSRDTKLLRDLTLAGCVFNGSDAVALTGLHPLKQEWRAQHLREIADIVEKLITVKNFLLRETVSEEKSRLRDELESLRRTGIAVASGTAVNYPAYLRTDTFGNPMFPISELTSWSVFSYEIHPTADEYAQAAFLRAVSRLIALRPEVASHLRLAAFGRTSANVVIQQLAPIVGKKIGGTVLRRCEIVCIGERPSVGVLEVADAVLHGGDRKSFELRFFESSDQARSGMGELSGKIPFVHLAVVAGMGQDGARLPTSTVEVKRAPDTDDILFTPRTSIRPGHSRKVLLAPPRLTPLGHAWAALQSALDDEWPSATGVMRVPEMGLAPTGAQFKMLDAHKTGLWVATIDRFASREAVERSVGAQVAILHQETRVSPDMPMALIISQLSGGETDSAITRSLRTANILKSEERAKNIGPRLRAIASQGYGGLALEAATTGTGINELVAHVVAFSILGTHGSPWPLPPGCRILLINLDQYQSWFGPGKRADMLAVALDVEGCGVHIAAIEVKARRSDEALAASEAVEQLRQTLRAFEYLLHPDITLVQSRLWLSRIYDAALAFVNETGCRLSLQEINLLEQFRYGEGALDIGALGFIFGPNSVASERHHGFALLGDRISISISTIPLTEALLDTAVSTDLTKLATVETGITSVPGGRLRRRPEKLDAMSQRESFVLEELDEVNRSLLTAPVFQEGQADSTLAESIIAVQEVVKPSSNNGSNELAEPQQAGQQFSPLLGFLASSDTELVWEISGERSLPNGHAEVWGSSGSGKTQFLMALLTQFANHNGAKFGVLDFKNDYGGEFPDAAGATHYDMWNEGAPFNPLALITRDSRSIAAALIHIRDMVKEATESFMNMGHRQAEKLTRCLERAYALHADSGEWPTLSTLDDMLDSDLRPIIGDLTKNPIFRDGRPLGDAILQNIVFGLSTIPGNGQTTILAGGLILSALLLKMQSLPPVARSIRYVIVIDEAHRVAGFKAIDTMIREGRSKGLSVILATQQPNDLPEVVGANAQTRICFRLPDATMARAAARRLDPNDKTLAERIRTLGVGEAFVSFGGSEPQFVRMLQFWKDRRFLI